MSSLRFGVLGPVTVWRGSAEIGVGPAKHSRVLSALLLDANTRVDREKIIDVVWGDDPPKSGVNLVQKYIGDLRRLLARHGAGELIQSMGTGYLVRLAPDQLDSWMFTRQVEEARAARTAGRLTSARQGLDAALRLWRGEAFGDIDTDAVVAERVRLEESRMAAIEERVGLDLMLGDTTAAIAELSRLSREHPLRERLRELQMLALYRAGRQAEALTVYDDTRRQLADELGVDPGPKLQLRYEQILRADTTLDRPAEVAPELEPGLPPAHQLPRDMPDFVGRARPREALVRTLGDDDGPPPVSLIVGQPGVGKSTLAVHAAHAVTPRFPDGQLYLDLAGTTDAPREPASMLAELLRAIGVRGAAVPDGLDERSALYRSRMAGRRVLIVLDDAAGAGQVDPLLPGTSGCAVVITSRHRLADLTGAQRFDLDVFSPDEALQLLGRIVGADRTAAEPEHARAIIRTCGHLPLAIRVAGAKLASRPGWSLRVLRERLADQSRQGGELRVGELNVYASFDLSLRLLPADTARAFRLLGLLGSQTLPGWVIGPLLDSPRHEEVLDELVDASLLTVVSTDPLGQPRYWLHDLLREYAAHAAEDEPDDLRRAAVTRLLATWLHLAEQAREGLPPSVFRPRRGGAPRRPLTSWRQLVADPLAWFDAERSALRAAVTLATDWGFAELAWELAATLVPYYDHRSLYDDWQRSHELALRAAESAGNRRGEAALLRGLGQVHTYRDAYDDAIPALEQSRLRYDEVGDQRGAATAIAGLAAVHRITGRYDDAVASATTALDLLAVDSDPNAEAQLRNGIGIMRLAQGRHEEAETWFQQALILARRIGDQHREATVLRELSGLHEKRGDLMRALTDLGRALTIFERIDDERCSAFTLLKTGRVQAADGRRAVAIATIERALSVFWRLGNDPEIIECTQLLKELHNVISWHDK